MGIIEHAKDMLFQILMNDSYVGNVYDYGLTIEGKVSMYVDLSSSDVDRFLFGNVDEVESYLEHASDDLGIDYDEPFGRDAIRVYVDMLARACVILYTRSSFVDDAVLNGDHTVYMIGGSDSIAIKILDDVMGIKAFEFEEIW